MRKLIFEIRKKIEDEVSQAKAGDGRVILYHGSKSGIKGFRAH
jgi:hypothetical protein